MGHTPSTAARDRCFACDRVMPKGILVDTRDDQRVLVGSECYRLVVAGGEGGYQPLKGGPRLYPLSAARDLAYRLRREART